MVKQLLAAVLTGYLVTLLFLVGFLSHQNDGGQRGAHLESSVSGGLSAGERTNSRARIEKTPDFKAITDIRERKQAFFDFLEPLVVETNRKHQNWRKELLEIKRTWQKKGKLRKQEDVRLAQLQEQFDVSEEAVDAAITELELRINTIPVALVLAQAATESAWGTSRFARQGNNLFGQWCFSPGCGLVPKARSQGSTHEVASFQSAGESVASYFRNINTFIAYQDFRLSRQRLAKSGKPLSARALLPTLLQYSERGEAYLDDLRAIIRQNNLEKTKESA